MDARRNLEIFNLNFSFSSAFKGEVRSSGWLVEQKHQKPEMRVRAFQTEKDTEPVDEDEKDDMGVHEDFQTDSKETKGETSSDKIGWKSVKVSHQEKADDGKENEEVMIKMGRELKDLLTKDMSDENRPVGNETGHVSEEEPYFKDFVVSSTGDGKMITSIDGFGNDTNRRNPRFDINHSSTHGISTNTVCPNSANSNCSAAKGSGQSKNNSYSNEHGIMYRKLNIPRSDAKDAWTHFTIGNFDTNTSALSDLRLTKGGSELDEVSTALKLKEVKCINKPDSVNSKADEGDNLQIREFESERSVQPSGSRDLICSDGAESDLNSGAIGEALHWSLFTGDMDAH